MFRPPKLCHRGPARSGRPRTKATRPRSPRQFDGRRKPASPGLDREVAEIVFQVTESAFFDRLTEAAGLPIED